MQNEVVPGLIDPDRVPDVFAEGLASIERIGAACLRLTLYAKRDLGDGDVDRIVVARIVGPGQEFLTWLRQAKAVLAGLPFVAATGEGGSGLH